MFPMKDLFQYSMLGFFAGLSAAWFRPSTVPSHGKRIAVSIGCTLGLGYFIEVAVAQTV